MAIAPPRTIFFGNPATSGHQPDKALIVAYLEQLEALTGTGAIKGFAASVAALPASGNTSGDYRLVLDSDPEVMGVYQWGGSSWSLVAPLPSPYWNDAYALLSQAWAESTGAPGDAGTKSAKTHAGEAAASATAAAGSASSAAASAAAAGVASGRFDIGSFSELASKFVASSPGAGQQAISVGDIVLWRGAGAAYQRVASGGVFDYTGTGGVRFDPVPIGYVTARQFGIDTTGATVVTAQLTAMLRWCVLNSVPINFDGCTFLIDGTAGPEWPAVASGRLHFLPGKWRVNATDDAAPDNHALHFEVTAAADFLNESEITIDCKNRLGGGLWFRHYGNGGVGRNTGFIRVLNCRQNDAAFVGANTGLTYFGDFDFVDAGKGEVKGINRVQNCFSGDTTGLVISGTKEVQPITGWRFENVGKDSQLPLIVVTNVTQANPAVVTAAGHGLVTGSRIIFSATNSGAGAMTQLYTAGASGVCTVTRIDANTFSLDGVNSTAFTAWTGTGSCVHELYDFDCIKVFGKQGAALTSTRTAQAVVSNCKFIDFTGRAVKFQTPGRVDDCLVQINGIPLMQNFAAFDGQIGSIRGRGNRFEIHAAAGVNPFLTGLSASLTVTNLNEIDNEMAAGFDDTIVVTDAAIPRLCAVTPTTTMMDGAVQFRGLTGLRGAGYVGNIFSRAIIEVPVANIQTTGKTVRISLQDADGPFGAIGIGYVGYSSGAITNLTMSARNCRDTSGVSVRPIHNLSGSQITDMTRFLIWDMAGYNLLYASVNFNIQDLPPCTEFAVISGSGTITNGPTWTGQYAKIRSKPEYLGAGSSEVEFEVHNANQVPVIYRRYAAGSTWTEHRGIARQPAPSSTVPAAPTGGETVDAESRTAIDALIAAVTELRADLTAAGVSA